MLVTVGVGGVVGVDDDGDDDTDPAADDRCHGLDLDGDGDYPAG